MWISCHNSHHMRFNCQHPLEDFGLPWISLMAFSLVSALSLVKRHFFVVFGPLFSSNVASYVIVYKEILVFLHMGRF